MKTRSIAMTVVLCFLALTFSFAEDANMGTWKLNEAKSKIPAGAIKNTTVTYAGKFDGKDSPLTGDRTSDARSYAKVNDHTLTLENKKDGKATTKGKIVVSADGKTRTLTTSAKDSAGKPIKSTAVYDKQ
jgi:hypothetical protein